MIMLGCGGASKGGCGDFYFFNRHLNAIYMLSGRFSGGKTAILYAENEAFSDFSCSPIESFSPQRSVCSVELVNSDDDRFTRAALWTMHARRSSRSDG